MTPMKTTMSLLLVVPLMLPALSLAETKDSGEGWIQLFDGETLEGWTRKSGYATYEVVDGAIVGTTAEGSGNTFLCTNEEYADFELQFEVKVDDKLNSGCQIRSKLKDVDHRGREVGYGGRVYGPQVEIESSPGQSGFIYGEATGLGWLSPEPKSKDPDVKKHSHMKNGEWNHFRIVAKGPRIHTFINGNPVADLTHPDIFKNHASGLIGLQVHGIKKDTGPFQVRWRNIKLKKLL